MVEGLNEYFEVEQDRFVQGAFILVERHGEGKREDSSTVMRVVFGDVQSGADVIITNMMVHPKEARRNGLGTKSIMKLISWARTRGLRTVHAVQVQTDSEGFWERNGFVKLNNRTNDFQLLLE